MAPPKKNTAPEVVRTGMMTRNRDALLNNALKKPSSPVLSRNKRKIDGSPSKERNTKRSALNNITNALGKLTQNEPKKVKRSAAPVKSQVAVTMSEVLPKKTEKKLLEKNCVTIKSSVSSTVSRTESLATNVKQENVTVVKMKTLTRLMQIKEQEITKPRLSVESTDSSMYISASDEYFDDAYKNVKSSNNKEELTEPTVEEEPIEKKEEPVSKVPQGINDFDVENWWDPHLVSEYAMDIFEYLKSKEASFPIEDYMGNGKQQSVTTWMRSVLVDWMVEIQESFELNHETLYLAVKMVDLYLSKVNISRNFLQLVGATSLFIACKYDERVPVMISDYLYVCDNAFTHEEFIRMEIDILKQLEYRLGIPLSYRFLRRYGRVAKVSIDILTLARYILEYSLMDYDLIRFSDSKMASACLFLALYMKDLETWTPTLEYYTGFKVDNFIHLVPKLQRSLMKKQSSTISRIRSKYSHTVFLEVAKTPLKPVIDLKNYMKS